MISPKVFISHASEDKERFVLDFAAKLRLRGIEAWIDKWEMYPGDSLIDKIFEEGIKNAQAVIVVLSKYSVDKPWVREELNASKVKKINTGSKLIPVVIDDCQIPECLQSTVWEKIKDHNNYEAELERIVMSIYGERNKPPIGASPLYVQTIVDILPGLTKIDSLAIKLSCEKAIEIGHPLITASSILGEVESLGIHSEEFFESLEILDKRGYIRSIRTIGSKNIQDFSITTIGFDKYARVYIKNYDSIFKSVALQIVNLNSKSNYSIAASLNQPQMIIDHILRMLKNQRLIAIAETVGGGMDIFNISPELKRILKEI